MSTAEERGGGGRLKSRIRTRDPQFCAIIKDLEKVLDIDANVLILGESGTGKDYVAESVHRAGPRAAMPFVKIDCTNLPAELFESELFGYERGAFTDAHERKGGKIEMAQGGTLYFDEVGGLDSHMQAKLLRIIQEKQFQRLGGNKVIDLDVRIIASSNLDLGEFADRGAFRKDLYYRLNVVSFALPPLRERKGDIRALAQTFAAAAAERFGRPHPKISEEVMGYLVHYHWPGNLRELKNVAERAVILASSGEISAETLPAERFIRASDYVEAAKQERWSLEKLEAEYIREILRITRGHKSKAADILGINRKTLLEKLKKYGLYSPAPVAS